MSRQLDSSKKIESDSTEMGDFDAFLNLDDDSSMNFGEKPDFRGLGNPSPSNSAHQLPFLGDSTVPSQQTQRSLEQRPPSPQRRAHKPTGIQSPKLNQEQSASTFRPLTSTYVTETSSRGEPYNAPSALRVPKKMSFRNAVRDVLTKFPVLVSRTDRLEKALRNAHSVIEQQNKTVEECRRTMTECERMIKMWHRGGEVITQISKRFEIHEAQIKQCMELWEDTADIVDVGEGAQDWQVLDAV